MASGLLRSHREPVSPSSQPLLAPPFPPRRSIRWSIVTRNYATLTAWALVSSIHDRCHNVRPALLGRRHGIVRHSTGLVTQYAGTVMKCSEAMAHPNNNIFCRGAAEGLQQSNMRPSTV